MARRVFLTFIVILFLVIGMLPVLSMLAKSVIVDGRISLASYGGLLASAHQWTLMGHGRGASGRAPREDGPALSQVLYNSLCLPCSSHRT